MGRKGGGTRGFLKAARRGLVGGHADEAEAPVAETSDAAVEDAEHADVRGAVADPSVSPSPPAAAPASDAGTSEDSDSGASQQAETRGRMLQRHKKELKDLKDRLKKAGKKAKEELKSSEAEMTARHAEELKKFDVSEQAAFPDSMYGDLDAEKKLTKAQKRRQKQLEQEAEREEAINTEVENMGETDRAAEERRLDDTLLPLGLQVFDIPADGNCMYRALAHQCQTQGMPELIENAKPDTAGYQLLRAKAAQYMRANPDDFLPFVIDDSGEDGAAQLERYCGKVESSAEWGTQVELQALAAALKVHIQVYNATMPVVEMGEEYKSRGRSSLRVCYLQYAYGSGEHYNSIIPVVLSIAD